MHVTPPLVQAADAVLRGALEPVAALKSAPGYALHFAGKPS